MKLWGGRFSKETAGAVDDFHSSIHFDQRLYKEDIAGSMAHAKMLAEVGIISHDEGQKIIGGLKEILREIEAGKTVFDISAEDIHMNVEKMLIAKIGDVGRKLHTARSRNDQVALDARMYVKARIKDAVEHLAALQDVLLDVAEKHTETVLPGYTHLQRAQPVTLAHHLMAYLSMFQRDAERFMDTYKRTNVMPLGSGALAGTTFPIDREFVARELDFADITGNSLDGVSDRDFMLEFMAAAAITMMHLSRFSEEIILWSSSEFNFIELDDSYSTGSSIMPQKKNPDVAELVRGKTGRVYGNLVALLTVMKGLPLAYNKDMQEDKEALFDTVDTVLACLGIFKDMLATVKINASNMLGATEKGFLAATDAADYLAKKGLPFRDAHKVAGQIVAFCVKTSKEIWQLSLEEFKQFSPLFDGEIYQAVDIKKCVEKRQTYGGPAPEQVQKQILKGRQQVADNKNWSS